MESKKINQLATELTPSLSDLTIIGDPSTGISKKITLSQMASLFTGTVEEYANVAAFPLVGVADTIYIALDTNVLYRWNTGTNAYVELSPNIINSLVFSDANGFDGNISLVGSVATLTITTALTTGSVPFIGASGALSQDNANLFFDDTNNRLGINTNAPTTALDVFGSGIIGRLNGTSTNNAFLSFANAGTNRWSIGNVQSDHRFRIYNEATTSELVSVLSTGEFGIGIANPTTKFHIDGAASALIANLDANVSVAKSISFRSDNSNRINLEVSGTESGSNAGANFFIRRYSDAGALIDTPLTITRSTGAISLATALSGTSATFSGDLIVDTNTLYVDSTNNLVGIGGTPTGAYGRLSIFGGLSIKNDNNAKLEIGRYSSGVANSYIKLGANSNNLRVTDNLDQFDIFTITNGGRVGVGVSTNDPSSTLHVKGLFGAPSTSGSSLNGVARFGQTSGDGGLDIGFGDGFSWLQSRNAIDYSVNYNLILQPNGGNVGINFSNPNAFTNSSGFGNLVVGNGSGETGITIYSGTTGSSGLMFADATSGSGAYTGYIVYRHSTDTMEIATGGGTPRITIKNNGNTLIGTSTDNGDKFQVNGGSTFSGNMGVGGGSTTGQRLRVVGASTTASDYGLVVANSSGPSTFIVRNDGAIFLTGPYPFTTASGANMWLDSSGVIQRNVSSIKYKTDVQDYAKGLNELMKLRPVSYLSKSEIDNPKRYAGMIAEELHELGFSEYVNLDENGEPDSISYASMVTLLTKSIQELKAEIDILKAK